MTTESWPGPEEYTISGTGPYAVGFEYTAGAIAPRVVVDGVETDLAGGDWSLDPASGESGNLALDAGAAATHDGRTLRIYRETVIEQGWAGSTGREAGLEAQLDRGVQAAQEAIWWARRSLRTGSEQAPVTLDDGAVPIFQDGRFQSGPTAGEITAAQGYATSAASSASVAGAAKTAAETARDKAQEWAENPEDTEVESGKYSALHHAAKALASATAAEGAFADFDVRYLGAKASDPATDNNGDPLVEGALYFNSTSDEMRVYDGSSWIVFNGMADAEVETAYNNQVAQVSAGEKTAGTQTAVRRFSPKDVADMAGTHGGGGGGGGDVTGPASSTDDHFASFDGATGKLLQDSGKGASDFATSAQGAKADTATQPGDLATVATTGAYGDLSGKPTLGTAAASDTGDFATAAQGTKADNALPKAGGTMTGELVLKETKETVYTLSGTAIDPANGTIQTKTFSANTTFTESLQSGQSVTLHLAAGASYTITWPTITWVGGAAPTLTSDDVIVVWKVSTTLYGAYIGSVA